VLEKGHIQWYWEDIMRARITALQDIQTARTFARELRCEECMYCQSLRRHEEIIERTASDLILIVDSLREGMRPSVVFPKKMTHDLLMYRGFIEDTGRYVPLHKQDHSDYRKEYAREHGEERAYRMINIHGNVIRTKAIFCDRKHLPSAEQYATLKELMIDAQGQLSFYFMFDSKHPSS
jgi:hypothetical protein